MEAPIIRTITLSTRWHLVIVTSLTAILVDRPRFKSNTWRILSRSSWTADDAFGAIKYAHFPSPNGILQRLISNHRSNCHQATTLEYQPLLPIPLTPSRSTNSSPPQLQALQERYPEGTLLRSSHSRAVKRMTKDLNKHHPMLNSPCSSPICKTGYRLYHSH